MISPKSVSLLVPKPFPWPHSGNKSKTCGRNQSEMASPECFSTIHPWVLSGCPLALTVLLWCHLHSPILQTLMPKRWTHKT